MSKLFVPGTHNSGVWKLAKFPVPGDFPLPTPIKLLGADLARSKLEAVSVCQDRNLVEQFHMGVRAFDIRVAWDGEDLRFAHTFFGPRAKKHLKALRNTIRATGPKAGRVHVSFRWDWHNRQPGRKGEEEFLELWHWLKAQDEWLAVEEYRWNSPGEFTTSKRMKLKIVESWHKTVSPWGSWLSWALTPDTQWVLWALRADKSLRSLAKKAEGLWPYVPEFPAEVVAVDFVSHEFVTMAVSLSNAQ